MKKAFYDEKNQPQNFIVLSFLLISYKYNAICISLSLIERDKGDKKKFGIILLLI